MEERNCKHCQIKFHISKRDASFYEQISPIFNNKKYQIPLPTFCPSCRNQRRLSFRNERNLYRRKCDLSGKDIVSLYSPDKPVKVYCQDVWWGDAWDGVSYGREYDFSRGFFDQFKELFSEVPLISSNVTGSENSDFSNFCVESKNAYLSQRIGHSEDIYYTYLVLKSKDIFDSYNVDNCENSLGLVDVSNSYGVFHCQNVENCKNSQYLFDCTACSDCMFSTNLVNKQYYFLNKQYSKEDYEEKIKHITPDTLKAFDELKSNSIVPAIHGNNYVESIGNYLVNCKGNNHCFDNRGTEDVAYCNGHIVGENSMDTDFNYMGSYNYENIGCMTSNKLLFSFNNQIDSDTLIYCMNSYGSSNCFGCAGLKNKQYCILNKQYTKEQYEALVPKIIEKMESDGEWGEFFPSSLSPFGYNETVANEYFPLTKKEALDKGFNWSDYETPFPKVEKIIPASKLPENITDIPDDILNWAIECEVTKKPFRIIKPELEFYRKHSLPIPKRHPDQRHLDRMNLRNPRKLYERGCDKCEKDIQTTYSPERKETVYCEECYHKAIY